MPELASIHIPKTAGRSFLQILKMVYPENTVAHFHGKNFESGPISKIEQFKSGIDPNIKVIHGHFHYKEIKDLDETGKMKVITWVRDPVERVISNFSFFKKRITLALNDAELQRRKNETLMEYAVMENSRNRMTKFLDGLDVSAFCFIGITEQFNTAVLELGRMLDWPDIDIPRVNDNRDFKSSLPQVTDEQRRLIGKLNEQDIELYHQVREIRKIKQS